MKKVSLLLVLVFAAITMSAQESGFSTKPGRNTTFADNGFWDNWFIGIGAGANVYLGDNDSDAKFLSRPTVAPQLQFGKWFNPYIGGRFKFTGGAIHTFENNANDMMHHKYVGGEFDFMWNVSDYLLKYNSKRVYSFIPFVGLGAAYGWDYKVKGTELHPTSQKSLTLNAGIINNFRLSNRLSLAIEISASTLKDDFDKANNVNKISYDILANASASLVYKLGSKTDFSEALLMDQGLVDDLNNQINKLRQENARLSQRPENCPKCPEVKTVEKVVEVNKGSFVSNVVFFRLGSANIDKNQEVSIFNTAKYLQDNPNAKVKIVGYADKKTGNPTINNKLSEKRAKNVANALINKYNINSNRVTVEWKGDTEQPYAENAWNRVAIFFAE
ncbi:OmpA family protein [Dysgonomonas sp. BGC7]|uniref:OmpA family protein n=1 Tax=Dysgonomonas sp. BGC7 TaxID=1658008 RepID=UPI000680591F|nr:OmpA family protein [Dysgonomonas sp. BGC7]MBD8389785.1 OmpA family protein [Dysgonomonas sp. BGC7]